MGWFTGVVLFTLIWWTTLFAVLPVGTRPVADADPNSGWRGSPERPRMRMKILATTAISILIWLAAYWLIQSDYLSFRHGMLAAPDH